MMILRIIIFGLVFLATIAAIREFPLAEKVKVPELIFCGWLFINYMALLYWEIHSRIRQGATQKQIRWEGFHLTFWAGFFWGIFFASPWIDSAFTHPSEFFSLLPMFALSGVLFGILGMAITQFMVLFLSSQRSCDDLQN